MQSIIRFFIGLSGAIAVIMGAVAAHALKGKLPEASLEIIDKAVFYQIIHTLALLVLYTRPLNKLATPLFCAGIILFSGSLYIYALTAFHPMVYLTPLGGFCLIFGWLSLAMTRK